MGLGLMALGQAPRAQAAQGLMGLFNSMDQAEQRKADAAYRNAQIAELQRKGQAAQRQQDMIAGLFGVGQPQAAASGAQTAGPAGFNNATLNQIAALKAMGGPDLLEAYKLNQSGVKMDAGNYYMKDGQAVYLPKAADGMVVDPRTGQARALPGYADANASIEAAKTAAVEGAKYPYTIGANRDQQQTAASLDLAKIYNPATGREEYTTRAQVVRPQAQFSGAGYAGGSAAAAAPEQLQIMQSELKKLPPNHPDRPAIMREIQRLGGGQVAQSGNYAAGPSAMETAANEAARARAVDTAKADVVRDTGRQAEGKLATKLTSGIDRAIELLQQGPTSSAVGTLADKAMGLVGTSTKSGELAAQLGTLSGWLVSNVPRMEGPQSNIDVQNYQAMAGRVGDSSLPIGMRLAAAQEVKRLQQKYMHLNGGEAGGEQSQQAQQPAQREFSMLPKATEFDGKRMRAPDGSIYRSSGGKWVKE